jgi:hypothetical protein
MTTPSSFEIGKAAGGGFLGAVQESQDVSALDEILQGAAQSEDPNALDNAMNQILSNIRDPARRKEAIGVLQQKQKGIQTQMQQAFKEKQEREKEEKAERSDLRKARIKSEFESPEIKEYRKNLGLREDIAGQLTPALENARRFADSPSRFIPGTEASKALGDLATRAFAFYKPLFGGRVTQREFVQSIKNLSADRALPGGFNQAINLIDSMIKQADLEGDTFSDLLAKGESPFEARRQTKKFMKNNAGQILDILQRGSKVAKIKLPEAQKPNQALSKAHAKSFLEKAGGDKDKARELAKEKGFTF